MSVVLAVDTATSVSSLALRRDGRTVAAWSEESGRRHAEILAPALQTLFGRAGLGPPDVDLVAVDVGPGLFTGLRVGVATAKAFAAARRLPVVPVLSLDALAAAVEDGAAPGRSVLAVVDARRGQVFTALYRDGVRIGEPAVSDPAEVRIPAGALVCGDGAVRYAEVLGVAVVAPAHPDAAVVARLAAAGPEAALAPVGVRAFYLREPDVRIGWATRDDRSAVGA